MFDEDFVKELMREEKPLFRSLYHLFSRIDAAHSNEQKHHAHGAASSMTQTQNSFNPAKNNGQLSQQEQIDALVKDEQLV